MWKKGGDIEKDEEREGEKKNQGKEGGKRDMVFYLFFAQDSLPCGEFSIALIIALLRWGPPTDNGTDHVYEPC